MQAIRKRLTYANVVSTLALFLVLAGGAAYAAKVAKKSVGPRAAEGERRDHGENQGERGDDAKDQEERRRQREDQGRRGRNRENRRRIGDRRHRPRARMPFGGSCTKRGQRHRHADRRRSVLSVEWRRPTPRPPTRSTRSSAALDVTFCRCLRTAPLRQRRRLPAARCRGPARLRETTRSSLPATSPNTTGGGTVSRRVELGRRTRRRHEFEPGTAEIAHDVP